MKCLAVGATFAAPDRFSALLRDRVVAVDAVVGAGARKYSPNGWKAVPDGPARYMEALWRHLMAHMAGEVRDPQSGHRHMAHVAWNALAYLTLTVKRKRKG